MVTLRALLAPKAVVNTGIAQPSFREVYDQHYDFVWRSLRRLGVPDCDVADAVQEVFLVVHRRLAEFESRARITTWLFRICLHIAKDRRRRSRTRREQLPDRELAECSDERLRSDEQLEQTEDLRLLEAALAAMPLEQRAVFTLFELEGLSGQEIAATLDLPLGTVHSRLRLGRECFRRAAARFVAQRRAGVVPMAPSRGEPPRPVAGEGDS